MKSSGLSFEGRKIRAKPDQATGKFTDFLEVPLIGVPAKLLIFHAGENLFAPKKRQFRLT